MTPQNWRVVIADNNDDNVAVLEEALMYYESSMQVKRAKNGQECLHLINTFQPSLVIVDLALEEMDGWELLDAIRNNPDTSGLSVAAMTAYHSVSVERDALKAGFDAYFPFPINVLLFAKTLADLVK